MNMTAYKEEQEQIEACKGMSNNEDTEEKSYTEKEPYQKDTEGPTAINPDRSKSEHTGKPNRGNILKFKKSCPGVTLSSTSALLHCSSSL